MSQYERSRLLLGDSGLDCLRRAHIAVFGIGGVGGYVCEALVRSGVGSIDLYDDDTVSESNLNRQLIALHSTLGRDKVEVMAERLRDIDPDCHVQCFRMFYLPQTADQVDLSRYDYVVDAIDTITAKMELITRCSAQKIPIISAMGAGNKLNPGLLQVADIYKTSVCPLARVIRSLCRERHVNRLKVVYSTEEPRQPIERISAPAEAPLRAGRPSTARKDTPGSMTFVPAAMGLMIASEIVRDLTGQ